MYVMQALFLILILLGTFSHEGLSQAAEPSSRVRAKGPAAVALYEGKLALDSGNYERAVAQLSIARANLALLADYALYWRAQAHLNAGNGAQAAADIRTLRELSKKKVLARPTRLLELELAEQQQNESLANLYQRYLKDYPSDMNVKLAYARYLKKNGSSEQGIKMLREIFVTVSPAARTAGTELEPDDISAEDLLKRARNLNSGWLFAEAEQMFLEAIKRNSRLRSAALDGLAYSLFRQKRYPEAAEMYAQTGNTYWHARSLLRANNLDAFEAKIPSLLKSREGRNGSLLLAFASKKRRAGDQKTALRTYQRVASSYVSEKEEAFWLIGWMHYRQQDFTGADDVFTRLHTRYGGLKYLYWKGRCEEKTFPSKGTASPETSWGTRDFYGYLTAVRQGIDFPEVPVPTRSQREINADRADLLAALGFLKEASHELRYLADKSTAQPTLVGLSEQFRRVGDFKNALQTAMRVPYTPTIHDLHYPLAYWEEVEEAGKKNGVDPYLLLAVIREESRFDTDARSIAGARGLMQLMPQTAQRIAAGTGNPFQGPDTLFQPRTNILIGAAYLKKLITEFGGIPYAVAAYNAGEEVVRDWMRQGKHATVDEFIEDIPYYETQHYVKKVLTSYFQYLRMQNVTNTRTLQRQFGRL